MLRVFLFVLSLFAVTTPAQAQDAGVIEGVIAGQLDAFNDRDVETAWGFASPMIQGIFGSSANFAMMVEQGYPMVWSNGGAEFLELGTEAGVILQKVLLTDATGGRHVLIYAMVETAEGWKINGVSLVPAPDVGV